MHPQLLVLARRQHGLLTTAQAEHYGQLSLIRRRLRSGEWVLQQPGVVRPALLPETASVRIEAVRLRLAGSPGTWCFSHRTAAWLLGFPVPEPVDIELLLPMSKRERGFIRVQTHYTERPFRVVTTPLGPVPPQETTVLQCASRLPRDQLVSLVEFVVRKRRRSLADLAVGLGRGVSGSAALRSVLDELSAEGIDRWMRRLVRLLVGAGLPRPRLEVPVYDGGRLRALLDGLWEDRCMALEVDDWETHGSRDAQDRDHQRDRWLLGTYGISTVRITPREIRDRPAAVLADLTRLYHGAPTADQPRLMGQPRPPSRS